MIWSKPPADAAVGVHDHPARKLGLRPPTPGRPALRLANYLTGVRVTRHPDAVDYLRGLQFGLYANDRFGVCGPTAVANFRRLVTARLTGTMKAPSQDDVYDLYRRSGNPQFDPRTGRDDNGVNMQEMLGAVVQGGIGGVKALGFARVDVSDIEELEAATALFGGLLHGVSLQQTQQRQTDTGVWDYQRSAQWGGHAVMGGAYTLWRDWERERAMRTAGERQELWIRETLLSAIRDSTGAMQSLARICPKRPNEEERDA